MGDLSRMTRMTSMTVRTGMRGSEDRVTGMKGMTWFTGVYMKAKMTTIFFSIQCRCFSIICD